VRAVARLCEGRLEPRARSAAADAVVLASLVAHLAGCGGAPSRPPPPRVTPVFAAPPPEIDAGPIAPAADPDPPVAVAPPARPPPSPIFVDPGGDPAFVFDRSAPSSVSSARDVLRIYDDRVVCFHDERPRAAAGVRFAAGSSRIRSLDALFGARSVEAALRGGPVLHAFADPAETATEDEGRALAEARGKAVNQLLARTGVPLVLPVVVHGWVARIDGDERARAFNRRLELAPSLAPPRLPRMWSALAMSPALVASLAASAEGARASAVTTRGGRATRTCVRARGAKALCFDPAKSGAELAALDAKLVRITAGDCAFDP